jgi:hypothetical protein
MNIFSKKIVFTMFLLVSSCLTAAAQTSKTSGRIPSDLKITLQRTMCFGSCPDYTLTVTADRKVVFKGGKFTDQKGTVRSSISRASLLELVKELSETDLWSFADDYSSGPVCEGYATDNPSEIISIRMKGRTKKVNHYFGCRGKTVNEKLKSLTSLGDAIDRITNSKRWVGGK